MPQAHGASSTHEHFATCSTSAEGVNKQAVLQLKVYEGELESRLQALLASEQLCITINSDDPAYFGGYMLDNWQYLLQIVTLSEDQIYQLHVNSFKASFLTPEQLDMHMSALQAAFASFKRRQLS
ncbi:hypothetical protein MMC07_000417 [Pseudocyphellaria aurata]|nr:hypothetical protein [Pseudocyphellaria aurata]